MKSRKFAWMLGCAVAFGGLRFLAACGDDSTSTAPADGGTEASADTGTTGPQKITGNQTYSGTKKGVAAYIAVIQDINNDGNPPPTAPLITSKRIANPTFPSTYEISPITPGKYVLEAYVATGTDHDQGPTADDPQAIGPVTIVAGVANTVVNLDYQDLPPMGDDGGGDSGDSGGSDAMDAGSDG